MAPTFELELPRVFCLACGAEQDDPERVCERMLSVGEGAEAEHYVDGASPCWRCGKRRMVVRVAR